MSLFAQQPLPTFLLSLHPPSAEEGNERITVEHQDYGSRFQIVKGKREDTAKYRFRIENCNGDDEEWLELVVLGPPSRPMGPLTCTDITASTCKLHWLPSKDDGGKPIQASTLQKKSKRKLVQ